MLDIIRQFNSEGLPHFQLNILRKKIQVEFVSQGEDKEEEIEVEKFKSIFNSIIKFPIKPQTMQEFMLLISDEKQEFVQYEKFNRLVDLYYFIPGKVLKRKNDSENMYLVMSSMSRSHAEILNSFKQPIINSIEQKKQIAIVEKFWYKL